MASTTSKPGPGEIALPPDYGVEILRTEVGSTLHGTGLGVAHEDHDVMGVFLEGKDSTIGLDARDHYVTRTAPKSERSQAGDTDLVVYSLRKWSRLALSGNPSVLLVLFAPDDKIVKQSELGVELRNKHASYASKGAGRAFLGYMEKQRQRMLGERGRAGRVRVMPDGGVDWKYAMHMLRLGYQGVEYLTTGRLTLPMPDDPADWLREVRQGNEDFDLIIKVAESLEDQVKRLLDGDSPLPDFPDRERVERFVINAHLRTWGYE
jgi:predicted nucleotidyltransferase